MLYIFDLGNVIVDIDFNRVLGAWSDFSRVPLATLKQNFAMGETFHQHERGEISDEEFAERFCHEMDLSLSYEQFSHGWQAVFVAIRPEVIDIMHKLREQGIVWLSCQIPTVCTPRSGLMNTLKLRRRPIISIFRRRWGCVSLKREFIRLFAGRRIHRGRCGLFRRQRR
jgi:hypothetical protein